MRKIKASLDGKVASEAFGIKGVCFRPRAGYWKGSRIDAEEEMENSKKPVSFRHNGTIASELTEAAAARTGFAQVLPDRVPELRGEKDPGPHP